MEADESSSFATADGIAVGTIDYMSPEQACGKEVDGRSDLYSLGCAMFHLMTAKLPFPGESPIERLGKRISGKPVPILEYKPDLPAAVVDVMDCLMAHKPQDRYQTAAEAAEALQALSGRKKSSAARPAKAPNGDTAAPIVPAAPPHEPQIVTVAPEYPGWFRGMAALAERSPAGALAAVVVLVLGAFALGFVAARLLG
jgi:serine/threonine-protein kinase